MTDDNVQGATSLITRERHAYLQGGAAGDIAFAPIADDDKIKSVWAITMVEAAPPTFAVPADLTSEFSIKSGGGAINNTDGTDTTGTLLILEWFDRDWTELAHGPWV
jgi:hypothetical protein